MSHEIEQRSDTAPGDAPRHVHSYGPAANRDVAHSPHSSFIIDRSSFSSSGFTLVELMIGAVVMTMTLAALTALTLAVSDGWRDAERPQSMNLTVSRGANRFLEMIKSAKYLGWAGRKSDGNGSVVLLWEQDDNDVGRMQLGEVALLEFDPGPKTVTLYRVPATAANAAMLCDVGDIDDEADAAVFKKAGNVTAQVVLHDVIALDVWAHDNAETVLAPLPTSTTTIRARPSLEYALRLASGNDRGWSYETVTLRAPSRAPVKCAGDASCTCKTSDGCTCASAKSCACSATAPCRTSSTTGCCAITETASGTSDATQ